MPYGAAAHCASPGSATGSGRLPRLPAHSALPPSRAAAQRALAPAAGRAGKASGPADHGQGGNAPRGERAGLTHAERRHRPPPRDTARERPRRRERSPPPPLRPTAERPPTPARREAERRGAGAAGTRSRRWARSGLHFPAAPALPHHPLPSPKRRHVVFIGPVRPRPRPAARAVASPLASLPRAAAPVSGEAGAA